MPGGGGSQHPLTQHVTLLVLAATAVRDVGLDAEIDGGQVFDRVLLGIKSPENGKSFALVKVITHTAQHVGANSGKREGVRSDEIAIQFKSYTLLVELVGGYICHWHMAHP